MSDRLEREKTTVQIMLRLYCKDLHHSEGGLCPECQVLSDYAINRLNHCKFGESKPTCGKCTVHCYKPEMRKRIIEIMRYSGPKMLFAHPIAAIRHLMDGRKKEGRGIIEIKEHSLEMRGMPHRELEEYFLALGGKQIGQGLYLGPNWEVELSDEWTCTLGSIQVPATQVTFRVDEEDWPEIVKAFRFRFLSAGG